MQENKISYYDELNSDQICIEIIKRFASLEYGEDKMTIEKIFGEKWALLDKKARNGAANSLRKGIDEGYIKGIVYEQLGDREYIYTITPNDMLSEREIYIEMIKRFQRLPYIDRLYTMASIFGEGWGVLDKSAKEQAEEWFRKGIAEKIIKGIIFEQQDRKYMYKRIRSDKFRLRR